MGQKRRSQDPIPPGVRDDLLMAMQTATAPVTAADLAKRLPAPHAVTAKRLAPLLEEFVADGKWYGYPAKTAKGAPRYWDRDVLVWARAALLAALPDLEKPLTAAELGRRIASTVKLTEREWAPLLLECVADGVVQPIPPATKAGKPRYWKHDILTFGRLTALQVLDAKGPQTAAKLQSAIKVLTGNQFHQVLQGALQDGAVFRHPPLGKSKSELFGLRPPSPEPYLKDLGSQLKKIVAQLRAAEVSPVDLRRSLVQLIEAAGITFTTAAATERDGASARTAAAVDLLSMMKRLEPGAERGALVGARDLRRMAQMDKTQFDHTVLELARQGRLSLHRHDFASNLSPDERDELVTDGQGTFYIGLALRIDKPGVSPTGTR